MKIDNLETLLLQEMEAVKGGIASVCVCEGGAEQGSTSEGECKCVRAAYQGPKLPELPPENPFVCSCSSGAVTVAH